jgi:hypothetical protein
MTAVTDSTGRAVHRGDFVQVAPTAASGIIEFFSGTYEVRDVDARGVRVYRRGRNGSGHCHWLRPDELVSFAHRPLATRRRP